MNTINVAGPAGRTPASRASNAAIESVTPAPAIIAIRRSIGDADDWVIGSLTALVISALLHARVGFCWWLETYAIGAP